MSKTPVRKKTTAAKAAGNRPDPTGRELWFAGLGALSLTRKQVLAGIDQSIYLGRQLRNQANERIDLGRSAFADVGTRVRELADTASNRAGAEAGRAKAIIDGLIGEVRERAECLIGEAEARVRPVMVEFGLAEPKRQPRARKSASRPTAKATQAAKDISGTTRRRRVSRAA